MKRPLFVITLFYVILIFFLRPWLDQPIAPFPDQHLTVSGVIISDPVINDRRLPAGKAGISFDLLAEEGMKGKIRVFAPLFKCSYGDKIKTSGILSFFNPPQNPGIESKGGASFLALSPPAVIGRGGGNPFIKLALLAKRKTVSIINQILSPPYSSLLAGLLIGISDGGLSPDIIDNFRKAGTVHLLVVSGAQVSLLIGSCMVICNSLRFSPAGGFIITSLFNIFFVIMTGAGTSVVRAAIMAEAALLAGLLNRRQDFLTTLSFSALAILIFNPLDLFNVGFQLSYAATIALFFVAPLFRNPFLGIIIAPVLMTAPIVWYNFAQISLISFASNAVMIGWINIVVISGFAAVLSGLIWLPAAKLLGAGLYVMIHLIDSMMGFFAGLPFASYYLQTPPFAVVMIYYICFFTAARAISRKTGFRGINRSPGLMLILLVLSLLIWNAALAPADELNGKILTATFLDVGQGDSIFIELPSGKNMLVDGGPSFGNSDMGKKAVLPFLHKKGINRLDLVVLTHPHDDHVAGLVSVLGDLKVDLVLDSGQAHPSSRFTRFLELIDQKKIKYIEARAGQVMDLGGGIKGYILNPSDPLIEQSGLNNNSIVMRLVYDKVSILLMGDVEKEGEERILVESCHGMTQPTTVLKIGHHGSRTASSPPFLDAAAPEICVISCGRKNKFRHPHKSTLQKLNEQGIKSYRTDLDGAVTVKTDGKRIIIKKERN